jgi:adenylate cyclase
VIIGPGTAQMARRHKLLLLGETMLRGKEKQTTLYTLDAIAQERVAA